jgi:4-aminobutyrate aminotransferase-like enzyme
LQELGRERGLLFGLGGPFEDTLLVRPPLCINNQDAKYIAEAFGDAIASLK